MELINDTVDFRLYETRDEWHKIKPASSWADALANRLANPEDHQGTAMPWAKMDGFRLRRGEVTIWAGINGHGKSMILSHIMLNQMEQSQRVVIASMEMTPVKTIERMLKQSASSEYPAIEYLKTFSDWTNGRLWIYDHLGMVDPKRIIAVIRYSVERYKCQHFVIDSLMKCGMSPEDYAGQKAFLNELTGVALDTGVHIHLVAHARKSEKETDRIDKFSIKGTSEITDQVDNVVLVSRNKKKENDRNGQFEDDPDAFLTVAKQRHGDWEGTIGLWYHKPSCSYMAAQGRLP